MKYFVTNSKVASIVPPAFLFLLIGILLSSCDPNSTDDMYRSGAFQIKARVINSQDSLNLGDSLKVVFEIPDTIHLKGFPYDINASAEQIIFTDKTFCQPGEGLGIADSTKPGGTTNPLAYNWCAVYANPGNLLRSHIELVRIGNRLTGTYYVIPSRKGVFYIASISTGGYFEGNSTTGKVKCRIVFDFDVPDKHHNLLQPAIGVNNNLTPMINSMTANGQGLYVFAVK